MFIYNLGIWLYKVAVQVASAFNPKARLWVEGRRGIFERMAQAIGETDRVVWVHSASLGEFEQGLPVMEAIHSQHPGMKILLTFFSPSGFEIRKNYKGADYVFYLPADTHREAKEFLRIAHPEVAIFIKYEFWLNYLLELDRRGCRTFVISAIFRRNSIFFKWYGGPFRRALGMFDQIFVQDNGSKELLGELNIENVVVAGDTRFDRVAAIAQAAPRVELVERFVGDAKVFIAGSTWSPDEDLLLELIDLHPEMKFIIAPHEIEERRIAEFAQKAAALRYTQIVESADLSSNVLIIDTIGILSSLYQYASYAYIGGGFGVGIHNTLEAATFGLPIAFGPNYSKFKEARDMVELGIASSVDSFDNLNGWLSSLEQNTDKYKEIKHSSEQYVATNRGATDLIMQKLFR